MQKNIQERKDGMWRDLEWDATVNLGGAASVCELPATAAVKFPTSSIITMSPANSVRVRLLGTIGVKTAFKNKTGFGKIACFAN